VVLADLPPVGAPGMPGAGRGGEQVEERPVPAERGAQQLGVRAVFLPPCAKARLRTLKGRYQRRRRPRARCADRRTKVTVTGGCGKAQPAERELVTPGRPGHTGAQIAAQLYNRRPAVHLRAHGRLAPGPDPGHDRMPAPRRPHPPRAQRRPGRTQVALAQARPRRQALLVSAYLPKGDTFAELAAALGARSPATLTFSRRPSSWAPAGV
jgi:hypothetical protein